MLYSSWDNSVISHPLPHTSFTKRPHSTSHNILNQISSFAHRKARIQCPSSSIIIAHIIINLCPNRPNAPNPPLSYVSQCPKLQKPQHHCPNCSIITSTLRNICSHYFHKCQKRHSLIYSMCPNVPNFKNLIIIVPMSQCPKPNISIKQSHMIPSPMKQTV